MTLEADTPHPASRRAPPRATIKDVARTAGVSVTTVSNVLNGRNGSMTPDTLERVQGAIWDLGFRRSATARSLVRQRTSTIGLVIAEIETPLFLQAIPVIQALARAAEYDVLIYSARDEESEAQAIELLLEKDVAGVVFLSTSAYSNHQPIMTLTDSGKPAVLVNRANAPEVFDRINWDNQGGVEEAVAHLARLGHTRIAHLCGPPHRYSSMERVRGYRAALTRYGLAFDPALVQMIDYTGSQEAWRDATITLLRPGSRPTAIIAADDMIASVAMNTIQQRGLTVPHDISIVGIDDQYFGSVLNPPLTTVQLPVPEAGRLAIELLLARMTGDTAPPRRIVLPCPLLIRASTAPPVTDDNGAATCINRTDH
ncbi:MAG: LacI family DNA-binding transcriptional regulator [Thermomicrobiales bacterium]